MNGNEPVCVVSVAETQVPEPEPEELDELDPAVPEPFVQVLREAVTFFTAEWP